MSWVQPVGHNYSYGVGKKKLADFSGISPPDMFYNSIYRHVTISLQNHVKYRSNLPKLFNCHQDDEVFVVKKIVVMSMFS